MKLVRLTEIVEVLAGRRGAPGRRAVRIQELESYQRTIRDLTQEARSLVNRLGLVVDVLADPSNLPDDADDALAAVAAARALAGIGGNHVPNSDFSDGLLHWFAVGTLGGEITWSTRPGGTSWAGATNPTMMIYQDGNADQDTLVRMTGADPDGTALDGIYTTPGDWYQVSAKLSSHRCIANLYVRWVDENGDEVSREQIATLDSVPGASDNPESWDHLGAVVQAPAGAAYRQIEFEKLATETGQADSYAFLYQPFSVPSVKGAPLKDYSPGTNPVVAGSRFLAESVEARVMAADSITAENGAIKDLTVETLKVKDGAITDYAIAGSGQVLNNSSSWTEVCSVTVDTTVAGAGVLGHVTLTLSTTAGALSSSAELRVRVGGTTVTFWDNAAFNIDGSLRRAHLPISRNNITASPVTVVLEIRNFGGEGITASNMWALARKR